MVESPTKGKVELSSVHRAMESRMALLDVYSTHRMALQGKIVKQRTIF